MRSAHGYGQRMKLLVVATLALALLTAATADARQGALWSGYRSCRILDTTVTGGDDRGNVAVNSYRCRRSHTCRVTMLGIDLTGERYGLIPYYHCRETSARRSPRR